MGSILAHDGLEMRTVRSFLKGIATMQKPSSSSRRIAQLLLLSITLIFTAYSARAADTQVGSVTNVTTSVDPTNGSTVVLFWINDGGTALNSKAAVTAYADDVIRVRYFFYNIDGNLWPKEEPMVAKPLGQWPTKTLTVVDQGSTYLLSTPQLDVVVTKSPFKVDFKDKSGFYLSQDNTNFFNSAYIYQAQSGWTSGDYKLKAARVLPSNQAIFGLGEYGGPLNRHGREMEVWTQGTGTYHWGEFQNPVYMNMPFFYGVQPAGGGVPAFVYGIFFNNPCRPLFSFGSTKSGAGNLSYEAGDGQMDYFFFGGGTNHTMAGVMDRYSELTGRPTMLPKWAFGYQISRFSYLDQNTVTNRANEATAANIPLDAIHLDIDYMDQNHDQNISDGQLHQLSFNSNYPNPGQMAANCAAKGVKIVPLIEPWLEPGDPMYGEANGLNHFIKDNSSVTVTRSIYVGNVSWFDFSSTPMRQWWGGKIGNWLNSFPFAGIWNDLTEPEGGDSIPYDGLLWCDGHYGLSTTDSRRQMSNERNYFGLRSSQCSYEAMLTKYPNKRPFVLSRSGNTGLQRYAVSWSGDTTTDPFYRRVTIPFGLSSMISGAAWYGHDLGGFDGNPTGEQITRWHEFGSFLPYFREHASGRNGDIDREPWKYGEPYQTYMRNIIQFRYKLMPYLYSLAYNATQTGEPMNTPTVFKYFGDNNTASQNNYDFMVGDYLLAAPVYNDGTTTRQVYLPFANGVSWYYYPATTPTKYCGGSTVTVSAPVGTMPLFVRSGAIIPMGPSMQYMNQFTPGSLDINCWPIGNSTNTLYEDSGEGWDFTNSTGRVQTTFTSARTDTNWDFTISARNGTYNPGHTNYFVYCYNPQVVTSVKINNSTINSNSFTAASQCWLVTTDGKLGIKVSDDGTQKHIVVDWTGTPPSVCSSPTGSPNDLGLPGTWNGWTNDFVSPWLLGVISPPGTPAAANWYTNSIFVAASGGDLTQGTYQFKLRRGHDWASNWGLNSAANIPINSATSLAWNGSTNAAIVVSNGFYYSFRLMEPSQNTSATIAVLKTTAKPVGLTFNGISPAFPNSNDTVTVSITLSAAKSAEEHIYVRYTTDNWTTSQFVEATGSGTAYTAVVPALPIGTTVKYYVLSSTATTGTGLSHSTADALTLSLDTNNGLNYTYTPATIPWPGFGYPSDPANNIHHLKEEAIVGNGYMTVMLDQNGTVYDYYFPSVGVPAGTATANEGYHADNGPQWPPGCTQNNAEANGQMNLIAAMAGIAVTNGANNTVYWLKNQNSTDYTEVGQRWTADDSDVVVTSNRLNVTGYNIKVQQYDFVPTENAIPVDPIAGARSDGVRTNRAVHVKRILLTNNEATSKTINFYWDANFNVKGDDAYDTMSYEGTVGGTNYNAMVVYDNTGRVATGSWCDPNGYGGSPGTEYDPDFTQTPWSKSNSVYFATVMKLVTNAVTGAGLPAEGSWRDHTATDNQEGWIGKKITIPAGQTVEVDVMTVGSWDTFPSATGTHAYWGRPMINWFYSNNMSNVQAATEGYWSNWVNSGVTVNFPDPTYDRLFKRSLIVSKLHADPVSGAVIAGMHNGAYPFVWPRDGVYAAITFDRAGHPTESTAFYKWLNNAERPAETWGAGYFFQKYTTDGKPVWRNPQVDETASVPWGMYYHYLATGDGAFLSNNWNLAYNAARASSENGTNDTTNLNRDPNTHLIWSWNVWEDVVDEHLYSNASVVRGLQDAANVADVVGSNSWATTFRDRATDIKTSMVARVNGHVEASDISHLGLVYPFEVFTPNDPLMTNVVEWLHGRQVSGGTNNFFDNIVETDPETAGMVRRYNHKMNAEADIYWNGGPWNLATAWYGMYYARWQDYVGGKSLVNTNKALLDKIIAKLGPMGLAGEQIAVNSTEQKYPGFWLQTAWPNTWESHSTFVDEMMMFLDYKPQTNNTCAFAPKLPTGWPIMKFNNLLYKNQRFDVMVSEGASQTHADINKLTVGALNYDVYLRIPAGNTPAMVITNGQYYVPAPADYDTATGRVHIKGPLNNAIGNNTLIVTYGSSDFDGDGLTDSDEINSAGSSPVNPDTDGDLMTDGYEFNNGLNPNANDANLDKDGDGQNNLAEFLAGTAANNAGSALRITSIVPEGNDIRVTWKAGGGKTNMLQFTTGSGGGYSNNYIDLPPQIVLPCCGDVTTNRVDSGGATNVPSRFYRIRLVP
jgi:alpha-glucosidase